MLSQSALSDVTIRDWWRSNGRHGAAFERSTDAREDRLPPETEREDCGSVKRGIVSSAFRSKDMRVIPDQSRLKRLQHQSTPSRAQFDLNERCCLRRRNSTEPATLHYPALVRMLHWENALVVVVMVIKPKTTWLCRQTCEQSLRYSK